jgi:RimJ/RimL family protein N-acetyltransferase
MPQGVELETPQLWLRRWRPEDLEPFAALNADAEVMEHFPSVLSREETAAAVGRVEKHFENHGYGLWAVEVPGRAPFIGFIGLAVPAFETSFTPCRHVLYRLSRTQWANERP